MGDENDRKNLRMMSELDRETILAERRKKLDELEERHILKKRLSNQAKIRGSSVMSEKDKKLSNLEMLKKKRYKLVIISQIKTRKRSKITV